MTIADIATIEGRHFPAGRWTRNLAGKGGQPLAVAGFAMGFVVLDPNGGQVPWHNHEQEEVYFLLTGRGEICVGAERREIVAGQAVHLPSREFHQLTNIGDEPLHVVYVYAPGGDVAHWQQELDGTLPKPGSPGVPELPRGARPPHEAQVVAP